MTGRLRLVHAARAKGSPDDALHVGGIHDSSWVKSSPGAATPWASSIICCTSVTVGIGGGAGELVMPIGENTLEDLYPAESGLTEHRNCCISRQCPW